MVRKSPAITRPRPQCNCVASPGVASVSDSPTGSRACGDKNVNIVLGCPNRRRYCYARAAAKCYGKIRNLDEWGTTYFRLRQRSPVDKHWKNYGTVRFPTTHDITPEFLEECVAVIRNLLAGGNRVIICSKPRLDCIRRLCQDFAGNQANVEFRFTIGAMDDNILRSWEPGGTRLRGTLQQPETRLSERLSRQRERRADARCPQRVEAVSKTGSLCQRLRQHRDHAKYPAEYSTPNSSRGSCGSSD